MLIYVMNKTASIWGMVRDGFQWKDSSCARLPYVHLCIRAFFLPNSFWDYFLIPIRFNRGAATSETILLQQALQKLQKSQPYLQQSGRRLKGQREGKIESYVLRCPNYKMRAVCSTCQFTWINWIEWSNENSSNRFPVASNKWVPKDFGL